MSKKAEIRILTASPATLRRGNEGQSKMRTAGGPRVAVAMSGGLDSSVAAFLLLQEGFDVVGITMQASPIDSDGGKEEWMFGCLHAARESNVIAARHHADRLGIPHFAVSVSDEYRRDVQAYVRSEYRSGRTPNPCIRCNRQVKFGAFPSKAKQQGVQSERFATGHYARIMTDPESGRYLLKKGVDPQKDQSYFLSFLTQDQLRTCVFPLGDMKKEEVREIARRQGWLDLVEKKESQDFFNVGSGECVGASDPERHGPILDTLGERMGTHHGLEHYTIGQRKGLGLSGYRDSLYVIRIDVPSNALIVGKRDELLCKQFTVNQLNWISVDAPSCLPLRIKAKIRQQHPEADAVVNEVDEDPTQRVAVEFDTPQFAVAPGQVAAFYDGDTVVGAGIIEEKAS